MKKVRYILVMLILFCFTTIVNAAEGPFYFDWENTKIENAFETQSLYSDNFSFKNGSIVVRTITDEETGKPNIAIERHDLKGQIIAETTIESSIFFSGISDDNNIYIVIIKNNVQNTAGDANSNQYVVKLDENLKVVKELAFSPDYTPGVKGMINARIFGHDILAVKEDYLYVFCGEEYMLKTKLDLSKWENMEYSKTQFAKYFPDLSAEYDLLYVWMDKLYNGNISGNYLDMEVTTHVYEDKTISSGMRWYGNTGRDIDSNTSPYVGFIRIIDNTGKVIFEEVNKDYAKIFEARVIGDYIVAIGLVEGSIGYGIYGASPTELGNDIIVYNMDGEVVQTIETEGSYVFLNEIASGFIATHVESCQETAGQPLTIEGLMGQAPLTTTADSSSKVCTYNTEAYYLPLDIETKVVGKGKVEAVDNSRRGEVITFKVTPEKGYVLSEVRVTDKNGNVVTFTDYTFTMPNADVTIEATFNPENAETSDIAILAIIATLVFGIIAISFSRKKMNWLS